MRMSITFFEHLLHVAYLMAVLGAQKLNHHLLVSAQSLHGLHKARGLVLVSRLQQGQATLQEVTAQF